MSSRTSRPPTSKTWRGDPALGKVTVGFWVFFGFFVGLATSIGARVLLCPQVDAPQPATSAVVPSPAREPSAVLQRIQTARSILTAAVEGDGRWTEAQRLALKREVELLPDKEAHEIVHEMVSAIHEGKLRPE